MNDPCKIIFDFLQSFEPQVRGRRADPIPDEVRARMSLFARGELDAPGRQAFVETLGAKPNWLTALAGEVKAARMHRDV